MSQLSYADQAIGIAGQIADTSMRDVVSRVNENASAIAFGLGVKKGSAVAAGGTGLFDETSAASDELAGVTVLDRALANADLSEEAVPADNVGSLMRVGRIFVTAETVVADGDDAYVRIDDGVADATQTTKGGWGADDDSGTRRHVKGAKFVSAAAKGGLAVLELSSDFGSFDDALLSQEVPAITATTTVDVGAAPVGRHMVVDSVQFSGGVTAGDATDHYTIELKNGATVIADWDSDVGVDGAITQGDPTALNLSTTLADRVMAPGDPLTLVFTKFNAGADTTDGEVTVHVRIC